MFITVHWQFSGVLEKIKSKIRPNPPIKIKHSASSASTAHSMASEYEWSLVEGEILKRVQDDDIRTGNLANVDTEGESESEIYSETKCLNLIGGEELIYLEESSREFIWQDQRTKTWHFANTLLSEASDLLSERSTIETEKESYRWVEVIAKNDEYFHEHEAIDPDIHIEDEIISKMNAYKYKLLKNRNKLQSHEAAKKISGKRTLFEGLDIGLESLF